MRKLLEKRARKTGAFLCALGREEVTVALKKRGNPLARKLFFRFGARLVDWGSKNAEQSDPWARRFFKGTGLNTVDPHPVCCAVYHSSMDELLIILEDVSYRAGTALDSGNLFEPLYHPYESRVVGMKIAGFSQLIEPRMRAR